MSDQHFAGHADGAGELVVVTGMTGAGRSTAAKELEDLGFFVVDNLPPELLRRRRPAGRRDPAAPSQPIAVVVDVRSGSFFESLHANLAQGRDRSAHDAAVPRGHRRRPRPPPGGGPAAAPAAGRAAGCSTGSQREREVLADLRGDADLVIDTTNLNVHQLTDPDRARRSATPTRPRLQITVVSFGFKYGIPVDADFVADMRFLPNPYWVPELRPQHRARPRRRRLRARPSPARREFLERLRARSWTGVAGLPRARASGS